MQRQSTRLLKAVMPADRRCLRSLAAPKRATSSAPPAVGLTDARRSEEGVGYSSSACPSPSSARSRAASYVGNKAKRCILRQEVMYALALCRQVQCDASRE